MTDYLLPPGMSQAAAVALIRSEFTIRDGRRLESERAYYDTFDGLLHAAGLTAVWEEGRLALIERGDGRIRAAEAVGRPTGPLFAADVPPGRLSDALQALTDARALLPLVDIRVRERHLDVLDRERKTVARIRIQQPLLGRRTLSPRIALAGVRGYDKTLSKVTDAIIGRLGFQVAPKPLVDEAVVAAGGKPGGTAVKVRVKLTGDEPADCAAAVVLSSLLRVIEDNLDGTIADTDSEFLHDLRVSVRRSRAVQRELRGVFPPTELGRFRSEFRWLQQVTGDARDLDVYVLEFNAMRMLVPEGIRDDLEPVLRTLRRRRSAARRRMVRALRSERARALFEEWSGFLGGLEQLPAADRPDAHRPIARVAGARIAKVYRRMLRMGDAIGPLNPSQDYHELRKQGKELRYLLELFGEPLFADEVVRPMVKNLKALQEVLGRHQDREVQIGMLRSLGDEVSKADGGPRALMAMGSLIERLDADQRAAREEFAERFSAFASEQQRRVVRGTFK